MFSARTQAAINRALQGCFPDRCTITAPGMLAAGEQTARAGRSWSSACRFFLAEERYYAHEGTFVLSFTFRFEVPASTEISVGCVVAVHGAYYTVDRVLGLRLDGVLHVKAVRLRAER